MLKFLSFVSVYNLRDRFGRVVTLTGLSAFGVVLGFLQQLTVVRLHGTQPITDFYFVLVVIPQVTVGLAGSVIGGVLLPLMVRWRTQKGNEAEERLAFLCTVKIAFFGILFAALCFSIGLWQLTKFQGSPGDIWQAEIILAVCPILTWGGVMATWFATLAQSRNNYVVASFSMLCPAALGLMLGYIFFSSGPWVFAVGQVAGTAIQLVCLCPLLRASSTRSSPALENGEVRALLRKLITFVIMGAGFQLLPLIERLYAHNLDSGAVASIALANRLGGALPPLLLSGLSAVMFTKFAELAANNAVETVVSRMMDMVSVFHVLFAGVVFCGPFMVSLFLPYVLSNETTIAQIGEVLPDYFMAGSLAATGVLVGNSCNVIFKDYRLQIFVVYFSLAVYFLSLNISSAISYFGVRTISLSYVVYFLIGIPAIVVVLALKRAPLKLWSYAGSLGLLTGAWIMVRSS